MNAHQTTGSFLVLLGAFVLLAAMIADDARAGGPPLAERRPVTSTYWGVDVVDDYRYLEDVTAPDVEKWVDAQDAYARRWLDDYDDRDALAARVRSLSHGSEPEYYYFKYRGGRIFAMKKQPPLEQHFLVDVTDLDDPDHERTVVDPNRIDPSGATTIDFYVPSPTGRYVAVSLSENGTEDGTLHVFDRESGKALGDVIPRVNGGTAGGSVAWLHDETGFFYTRYPHPGERPDEDLFFHQQIWFHALGTPTAEDHYALGETFPRIAEIAMETSRDGQYVLATVSDGDGGEYEYWLRGPDAAWTKFAAFDQGVSRAEFGGDGALYLLSRHQAPNFQVLRLDPSRPSLDEATILVPEKDQAVVYDVAATESRLLVIEMVGGPTVLRMYDLEGHDLGLVDMDDPISSITGLVALHGDEVLFRHESYVSPSAWYRMNAAGSKPMLTRFVEVSPADFSDCVVRREFATADDGVRIPVDILMREDTPLDGSAPCILYGYGSYGISQRPWFSPNKRLWLEQGGIHAIASIRGGGEYGDAWHRAANLERKKRSMDDFAACASYLVEAGYTTPEHLAIEGGSAGGLLVYGTMAHYPDRMGAVVSHVGFGDALRMELAPNGVFNVTEFGTVTNEQQFPGMLAASPYHQIEDGRTYPSVLSLTGMNDPRVEPWQTFKMTAALQATGSPNPVLMRVSRHSGHGQGTMLSERDAQTVDVHAFLFKQFGMEYRDTDRRAD